MANAAGRLLGTLLSGLSYQLGGVAACLATAAVMAALAWVATRALELSVNFSESGREPFTGR